MKKSLLFLVCGLLLAPGCGSRPDDGGGGGNGGPACTANFTLTFPGGQQASFDGCESYSLEATFEFDPDDPPEVRDPSLVFHATTDTNFECWVRIVEPQACGEGYYRMDGSSGAVTFDTRDCVDVPDAFESEFASAAGYVHFTPFSAGSVAGNFSGDPLLTTVGGTLDVTSAEGVQLSGNFLAAQEIVAFDAEEAGCALIDGDQDGDGVVSTEFGGEDCDDTNSDNYPGNEEACDGVDNNCDGVVDEDCVEWTDEFVQQPAVASDILFVIDDSCSMEDEQEHLANRFSEFIQFFVEGTANDYHIGVVRAALSSGASEGWGVLESVPIHGGRWIDSTTGTSPQDKIDAFTEIAQVGVAGDGQCEMGLQASRSALTDQAGPGAPNAGFYREDALLSVIVVSDEIDHGQYEDVFGGCGGISPKEYISWFLYDLKGPGSTDKVFFTGIVGDRPGGCDSPLGGSADEGEGYWDVIDGVGGAFLSICSDDWSEGLALAGLQAVGLQTSFPLTHMPVEETLVVTVDDVAPGATSWSYDSEQNAVQFATEVPMESSVIRVEYERTPGN